MGLQSHQLVPCLQGFGWFALANPALPDDDQGPGGLRGRFPCPSQGLIGLVAASARIGFLCHFAPVMGNALRERARARRFQAVRHLDGGVPVA